MREKVPKKKVWWVAFTHQTFQPLVGISVEKLKKNGRVESTAWGGNTRACFKGKCLAL